MQMTIAQGLLYAGRADDAKAAAQKWGWPAEGVARLTPIEPLITRPVTLPNHFDLLWGASFATGDAAYVRPIYNYYAAAVSQPDIDVGDVVQVVAAYGNQAKTKEIAGKYPRETFIKLLYAVSALWSLDSNARQHKFVAATLDQFKQQSPQSAAVVGLDALRKARP
jgi:hypothetical protein